MHFINIQTNADSSTLEAMKFLLLKADPNAIFEKIDHEEECDLNSDDLDKLCKILESDNRGEVKYSSFEDFNSEMRNLLKNLGA